MELFLIGIFSISVLGAGALIGMRLIGPAGRQFDDAVTGRESVDQAGDFLFIFFPMLKFLGKLGVFRAMERTHDATGMILSAAVLALKRAKDEYKKSALDVIRMKIAKHLFNHPSTREHRATTSFFLKDIAEYKKKISNGTHEGSK